MTVFERAEKPGGLLRYGIPEFKMEKAVLDRRLAQMEAEGVTFVCSTSIGGSAGGTSGEGAVRPRAAARARRRTRTRHRLRTRRHRAGGRRRPGRFDAIVLAGGATLPRDLTVPGRARSTACISPWNTSSPRTWCARGALSASPISARGKRVIIIGGGDTGADCLGTAHRQGAASVHQFEILAEPPAQRSDENPWPLWPLILRTSSAHEEGGERVFSVTTTELVDNGAGGVRALRGHEVETLIENGRPVFQKIVGSEFELECELVLLAMGFLGTERRGAVDELGLEVNGRGAVAADSGWATNVDGVFVCGDQTRGQSLIVWAIAEGRSAAAAVDRWLMGDTSLPSPIVPGQLALR